MPQELNKLQQTGQDARLEEYKKRFATPKADTAGAKYRDRFSSISPEQLALIPEDDRVENVKSRDVLPSISDMPGIAAAIPVGVAGAVENYARALDLTGTPGMRNIIDYTTKFRNENQLENDTIVGSGLKSGIESTIETLTAGAPGLLAGLAGGPPGAAAGFALSSGTVLGLSEYSRFMDDLAAVGKMQGLDERAITNLQADMRGQAVISAIAEGGFEAVSNALQLRLLKFFDKNPVGEAAKTALKQRLFSFLKGSAELAAVEIPSELATGYVQSEARKSAGIPSEFGGKEVVDTASAVVAQSVLMKLLSGRVHRVRSGSLADRLATMTPAEIAEMLPEKKRENAKQFIKESPWINDKLPTPKAEDRPGMTAKDNLNLAEGEVVVKSNKINVQPFKDLIRSIQQRVTSPVYFFRNEGAVDGHGVMKELPDVGPLRTAFDVNAADQNFRHNAEEKARAFDQLMVDLTDEELNLSHDLLESVRLARSKNTLNPRRVEAYQKIEDILTEHPNLAKIIDGTKESPGLIEYFDTMRKRYQESMKETARIKMSPERYAAFEKVVDFGHPVDEALVRSTMNVEEAAARLLVAEARKGKAKKLVSKAATEANRKRFEDKVIKKRIAEIQQEVTEYKAIEEWGFEDYVTNIELGHYRIFDNGGNTLGFAETYKKAEKKAFELRAQRKEDGVDLAPLSIEPVQTASLDPSKRSKLVLPGEKNIFKVLKAYDHAMEKRILLSPLEAKFKREIAEYPKLYDERAIAVIKEQIQSIKGNYGIGDKIVDRIALSIGQDTGAFTKYSAGARSIMTKAKLGYRYITAGFNYLGGHGNTLIAVGYDIKRRAKQAIKDGFYIDPQGKRIDVSELFERNKHLLGVDLASGEGGMLRAQTSILRPLGAFTKAEHSIRKNGFIANYIYCRERFEHSHEKAVPSALLNLTYQNFSYNNASLPQILRGSEAKLIGQFKSYLVYQMQFLSQLRGQQLLRALEVQLALGGPRSLVYVLKSIPVLGAVGLLDDAEEFLLKDRGYVFDFITKGIGGLFGADITAAASLQLPTQAKDWAGVVLASMWDLWANVIQPTIQNVSADAQNRPGFITDRFIDWLLEIPVMYRYMDELGQSLEPYAVNLLFEDKVQEETEMPAVVIRDSKGNIAYTMSSWWDRVLLLAGASPVDRTRTQTLLRLDYERTQIRIDNRRRLMREIVNNLNMGQGLTNEMQLDMQLYGLDPKGIPTAFRWSNMTPAQRKTEQARLLEKAEKIDMYGLGK